MVDFTLEETDKHKVVKLNGEVDLYCVGDLKKDLLKIIDDNGQGSSIVIDMQDLKYMDSSGIALMANLQKKLKAVDGKFSLVHVNEDIMNVLRLSALDSFFRIYDSMDSIP
ncbi:MAG: STAS domain-containing protein [Leptospiraceae bacterium]|nr:STAS domain-containing protein [Leptospiraceae bacterium]